VARAKNTQNSRQFQTEKPAVRRKPYPYKYRFPRLDGQRKTRREEPLIDILEEDHCIRVVAEFVGFSTKNLKVSAREQKLILSAENAGRKYYKSLNLPKRVIPKAFHTTYKNGVLEILFKKNVEEKSHKQIAG
jgi:HSP20 family protein